MSCADYISHKIDSAEKCGRQWQWRCMLLLRAALISHHLPIAERDALLRCASYDFGVTLMSFGPRLAAGMAFVAERACAFAPCTLTHYHHQPQFHRIHNRTTLIPLSRHPQHYTPDCTHFYHLDTETIAPRVGWRGTAKGGQDQDQD
jgi:hypothetical protein